ncbi:phytanoyl-CoA dioxygenase family protein [bacterium]|nr:MAG: phytanoyl-CoA dioxygenase family protein [bacterium]
MTTFTPVSEANLSEYLDQGYTILPNVFSPDEMATTIALVEEFDARRSAGIDGTEGKAQRFATHLAEQDPELRAFMAGPKLAAIATEFLGPDVDLYFNQSVFKGPEGNRIFPWHQDDAYGPVEPAGYLTLWLALNDATEENGCISVLPGSHRAGLRAHVPTPHGLAGHAADDPDQGIAAPVPAGTIIAFNSLTLHKSGPNTSKGERKALVLQYCAAGLKRAETGEAIPDLIPVMRGGRAIER